MALHMLQQFMLILMWGAPFCGGPVQTNMLNMPKSASAHSEQCTVHCRTTNMISSKHEQWRDTIEKTCTQNHATVTVAIPGPKPKRCRWIKMLSVPGTVLRIDFSQHRGTPARLQSLSSSTTSPLGCCRKGWQSPSAVFTWMATTVCVPD